MDLIPETTVVRVVNVGDKPFRQFFAGTEWELAPGEQRHAPYYAACLWFGDPRVVNVGTKRATQYRTLEIERLSGKYGLFNDPFIARDDAQVTCEDNGNAPYVDRLHPNLPRVEVYAVGGEAHDQRIFTVVEDPEGTAESPLKPSNTDLAEIEHQRAAMVELQRQVAELQNTIAARSPEDSDMVAESMLRPADPATNPVTPGGLVESDLQDPQPVAGSGPKPDRGRRQKVS